MREISEGLRDVDQVPKELVNVAQTCEQQEILLIQEGSFQLTGTLAPFPDQQPQALFCSVLLP